MALCENEKTECFFVRFIRVFQFTPESCFSFIAIVTCTEPKGIVSPYLFHFSCKNLVFFSRILVPVIQYDDGNHLPTVRAGDGVTYIFPLVDTLLMAWLATASQYGLTC